MQKFGIIIFLGLLLQGCTVDQPFQQREHQTQTKEEISIAPPKALPTRTEVPVNTMVLNGIPTESANCLKKSILTSFKIPDDFIIIEEYKDGTANLSLTNPETETTGVSIDLTPTTDKTNSTDATMYANGTYVSKAWSRILTQCR